MGQDELWAKVHSMILNLEGLLGQGNEEAKSMWGEGSLMKNILKLMSIKSQIPYFATGKGYRVKLPRKNVVQNGMSNQQPYP